MTTKTGKVFIVGFGPGDEGMLTQRACYLLQRADIIYYDYLTNAAFLEKINPQAQKVYVGKKGGGKKVPQDDTNEALIRSAQAGKFVVRLKGGDPLIFGRGAEEALALAAANLEFELVPGITSAQAAGWVGIPLTHRDFNSTLTWVTGHEDPNKSPDVEINWQALAQLGGTLVIYMGMHNLADNVAKLIQGGMNPQTPVAVLEWLTYPNQQVLEGTLQEIPALVQQQNFQAPAVVVIGDVVKLRKKLDWMSKKPLYGRLIVVTRAHAQSSSLTEPLKELGAQVVELPTLEISPVQDLTKVDQAIQHLATFDYLVFSSVNAVEIFFKRCHVLKSDIRKLSSLKIAAVGKKTAQALEQHQLYAEFVPEAYSGDDLAAGLAGFDIHGKKILFPRSAQARAEILKPLLQSGAEVEELVLYENHIPAASQQQAKTFFESRLPDLITFTSASSVKNFVQIVSGLPQVESIKKIPAICIGPITEQAARALGFEKILVTEEATLESLIDKIIKLFND
ncbi:MAG: uroporphyrinogen-III C-methyltransferase [Deltaproteobacteria bacterium]|nr:uroporphyrinogen-III C-methyltransferase [Deltaproteobacteria bacterium]